MKNLYTVVLVVILSVSAPVCFSQRGVLDVTFGNNGKVVTKMGDSTVDAEQIYALATQPDDKIVAVGTARVGTLLRYALARYKPNGTLDSTFGSNGKVTTFIDTATQEGNPTGVIIQPDGKILVVGDAVDFTLIRYTSVGAIDSSFGANGLVKTHFSGSTASSGSFALRPDGKIVVAGIVDSFSSTKLAVIRYNTTGSIDPSFGVNGISTIPLYFGQSFTSLVLQPDNKIVIGATELDSSGTNDFIVARFNEDGAIDNSFGSGGLALVDFLGQDFLYSLSIQPDNKLIAAGITDVDSTNKMALARLLPNGAIDNTFGTAGKVLASASAKSDYAFSAHVQPDGKIVVTGTAGYNEYSSLPTGSFAVLQLKQDGSIDSSFGRHGVVTTKILGSTLSIRSVQQSDGKIVLGGVTNYGVRAQFAIARYEMNALEYYNTLEGSVFFDKNANGAKDADEPYVNNAKITISKQGVDTIVSATYDGRFSADDLDTGIYVSQVVPSRPYFTPVPATHTTSATTYFNTDSISFALQPIAGKRDLAVNIIPVNAARPGFGVGYRIFYRNTGTDTVNGVLLEFVKSSKLNFNSATPAATLVSGDSIRWIINNLKPLDTASIVVNLTVQAPPAVNIGDTLSSAATMNIAGELTPEDNTSGIRQIAAGSYDPNDKAEVHGGYITKTRVTNGEYLTYTIRFQNTGTDTAFSVYIRDTMDAKLDVSTLEMIAASANYRLTMNDGKCLWTFNNINLVDQAHNEPASHGYLVYRVRAKNSVQPGDVIRNRAAIYFDYNLPVYTNVETTTITAEIMPLKLLAFTAKKDGRMNRLQWSTANEVNVDKFEVERSADGREFNKIGTVGSRQLAVNNQYSYSDDISLLTTHSLQLYYRLKMVDKDGSFTYSPVRVLSNNGSSFSIYPNPASEYFNVDFSATEIGPQTITLTDVHGRQLLQATLPEATNKIALPKGITPGIYILRITNNQTQKSEVRKLSVGRK